MLNYDGFDFSEHLLVTDIGRPILPPQTLYYKQIYGRSGAYFFGKQHEPIIIPVEVKIYENSNMTYRQMVRFFASKLNKTEPKRIIFADEPEMFIEGIVHESTDLENLIEAGQGVINFFCPDPHYYAIEDEVFTYQSTGSFNFSRIQGNVESEPIIEIEGTNNGGVITIESDNTTINFDGVLSEGETLVLDSKLITSYVVQADGENRSANNDVDTMDFPILVVGANNIKFSVEGGATINEVRIYAKSRWV